MRGWLVLLAALLASSFYLVTLQYESRRLYVAKERAHAQAMQLAAEHERLVAQQRALTAPARVQQIAQRELQMRPAHPGITEYVTLASGEAGGEARR
ncbi:cell division protein FtsL [Tepidimonas taiwanensis]|uniref:Cell division protein FtsL n=1 Tax=Tepidimonas taiwanensis TaxID=307486 RepID=A0A554XDR5_9BURK|nr:cell division protein FtsL [Tepidimonas taiwanensis]MCX7693812.1 cell division protein FtsL [Tepidimonas taiwanensis]MDM7462509.1 cell division protein FtsL [Tepidimonas taiwanensis]TSE33975.1 Cell division protein FtsL [Tepidimonas taiwanensis]UBQ05045.1 cell division protein FtsL [Tepidimonas taiwanensis]